MGHAMRNVLEILKFLRGFFSVALQDSSLARASTPSRLLPSLSLAPLFPLLLLLLLLWTSDLLAIEWISPSLIRTCVCVSMCTRGWGGVRDAQRRGFPYSTLYIHTHTRVGNLRNPLYISPSLSLSLALLLIACLPARINMNINALAVRAHVYI